MNQGHDHSEGRRFFAESLSAETVELSDDQSRHALKVLRLGAGDAVELFDGAGALAEGVLGPAGRVARVAIRRRWRVERPGRLIELAFAVPKGSRLDWLLEKATELGAAALSPTVFERSVALPELGEHARRRWLGVLAAAAKQCGACWLPEIRPPRPVAQVLAERNGAALVGDGRAQRTVAQAMAALTPGEALTLLVGPEGGLTPAEEQAAAAAGAVGARLGPYTLRIETAAVALLAAAQAQ